jgi:hypothetical protein
VYINHDELFKHIALFGTTGYGKSTLMKNIMLQWINGGHGLCFLDPKGSDATDLIKSIPPHRIDDLVWLEPGNKQRDMVNGFNILGTNSEPGDPSYENEVASVVQDFVSIMKEVSNSWGARMDNVTTNVVKQLVRADEPFTIFDLTRILSDEEELDAFTRNYGDSLDKPFLRKINQLDEEEFAPVMRRLSEMVTNRSLRPTLAQEQANITIPEIVEEGKLLIVDTSNVQNDTAKQLITRTMIQRIWSAVQTTSNAENKENNPFYLCMDEFDKVVTNSFDMTEIISMARSFKLSLFIATQQPSALPDEVKNATQQSGTILSFCPGENHQDKRFVSKMLPDVNEWQLSELDPFRLVGSPSIDGETQSGLYIHTFAPYPPLRSDEEAEELKRRSLKRYGSQNSVDKSPDSYGVTRLINKEDSGYEINSDGDKITHQQLLETVYTAQLRNETAEVGKHDDWVSVSMIKEQIDKYVKGIEAEYGTRLSNTFEQISETELRKTNIGGEAHYRLGEEGRKKAFTQDTGSIATGGKDPHRILLKRGHELLTKLGYSVRLPTQEGEEQPDGLAEPPMNPIEDADSFESGIERYKKMVKQNPRLVQLFGSSEISIEAESTTIRTPSQTIKNLVKSVRKGRKCIFLVKDGSNNKGSFEYWAKAGENILTDPPFVRSMNEDGNRTFYSSNRKVTLKNDASALIDADISSEAWRETKDGGIALKQSDTDEVIAKFDSPSQLANPDSYKFPYHYYRDRNSDKTIVKDSNGDIIEAYEGLNELRKDGKFRPVYLPVVPDVELQDGLPNEDMWTFIIIPDDPDGNPKIYKNGKTEPVLTEHGAKIDPTRFNTPIDLDVETLVDNSKLVSTRTQSQEEVEESGDLHSPRDDEKEHENKDDIKDDTKDDTKDSIECDSEDDGKEDTNEVPDEFSFPSRPS